MNEEGYEQKLYELDTLINDPNMPLRPDRIWQLLEEISDQDGKITGEDRRGVTIRQPFKR